MPGVVTPMDEVVCPPGLHEYPVMVLDIVVVTVGVIVTEALEQGSVMGDENETAGGCWFR